MSTEYSIEIHRKCDDKLLGEVLANQLKNIFDSKFAKEINCESYNHQDSRFEYKDLENVFSCASDEIKKLNLEILEKKLMICSCKNVEIKHELEDDIRYLEEEIEENTWVMWSAASLQGIVSTVVEDLVKDGKLAYQYNCEDLPKKTVKYENRTEEAYDQSIWNHDAYCVIKLC